MFQFPVESREGQEERRKHNTLRKQTKREEHRRRTEPPALPSAGAGVVDPNAPPSPGQTGDVGSALPAPPPEPPWTGDDLKEFVHETVDLLESARVNKYRDAAVELKLSPDGVKEFETGAAYPPSAKAAVKRSAPEIAADVMNAVQRHTGIGPKFRHHLNCIRGMGQIWLSGRALDKKLDVILEQQKKLLAEQAKARTN